MQLGPQNKLTWISIKKNFFLCTAAATPRESRENGVFHSTSQTTTPEHFQKQSNGTFSNETTPNMKINSEMPPATIKGLYEYSKQLSEKVYSFELRGCVIGSIFDRK